MAEHAGRADKDNARSDDEAATQAMPPVDGASAFEQRQAEEARAQRAAAERRRWRAAKDRTVDLAASIVRWIGLIFAAILVLHVIFVIGDANPDNGIVTFARDWGEALSLGFQDLFTPDDAKLRVLVNYGIAALFWLFVSAVVAKIIRRLGGAAL